MDPNNNQQQINTQQAQQAAPAPLQQPVQASSPSQAPQPVMAATPEPTSTPQAPVPKAGSKKVLILMVILLILIVGAISYVLFAKNQLNNSQKTPAENTSLVIPTATIAPTATPATVDNVNVDNPAADLNEIEKDVQEL